jgi:uncharacterized protein
MQRRSIVCAVPALLAACAAGPKPVTLPGTQQLDLTGRDGVVRRLFVAVPPGPAPARGWPVFCVLDGNALFAPASLLVRNMAQRAGYAPALVVGIGYPGGELFEETARAKDYTPAAPGLPAGTRYGGAAGFLDFLQHELRPMLARDFGASPTHGVLFGHSFGGLFTVHTLLTRTALFDTYAAASPSLWWERGFVLSQLPAFEERARTGQVPARLLLTVGSLEQTPPPAMPPERAAALRARRQVDGIRELAQRLRGLPGLDVAYRELPDEVHGTAMLPALQRAVDFAFAPQGSP